MIRAVPLTTLGKQCKAAGKANLFIVFKTPAHRELKEIKIRNGKQIRPNLTVSPNLSLRTSNPLAATSTTDGKNANTMVTNTINIISKQLKTSERTVFALSFPSFCRTFENLGRNDALNAPSAKILRKILDNFIAINRQSVYIPAPKNAAMIHSRAYPTNRLNRVKIPTVNADFTTLIISPSDLFFG
jgi:hypothetical protein